MSGERYCCGHIDEETGAACDACFGSRASLASHRNSHAKRPCRICGRMIAVTGRTQHVMTCDGRITDPLPCAVFDDLLQDLVGHSIEIPDGSVCVVSTRGGAAFMSPAAALRRAFSLTTDEPVVLIPSQMLAAPDTPDRWRRRLADPAAAEPDDDDDDFDDEPPPAPKLDLSLFTRSDEDPPQT